jgi:hypothetical protein
MVDRLDPPRLYIAMVPMLMGGDILSYAPITLATSRTACWDKTVDWAVDARDSAELFDGLFRQCPLGAPPVITQSIETWKGFDLARTRASRIAWLKRRGCRVVAGEFNPTGPRQ